MWARPCRAAGRDREGQVPAKLSVHLPVRRLSTGSGGMPRTLVSAGQGQEQTTKVLEGPCGAERCRGHSHRPDAVQRLRLAPAREKQPAEQARPAHAPGWPGVSWRAGLSRGRSWGTAVLTLPGAQGTEEGRVESREPGGRGGHRVGEDAWRGHRGRSSASVGARRPGPAGEGRARGGTGQPVLVEVRRPAGPRDVCQEAPKHGQGWKGDPSDVTGGASRLASWFGLSHWRNKMPSTEMLGLPVLGGPEVSPGRSALAVWSSGPPCGVWPALARGSSGPPCGVWGLPHHL